MGVTNWFAKAAALIAQMVHPGPRYWMLDRLPRTKFDYEREVGDGLGSNVIMAPIFWIARTFPEAILSLTHVNAAGEEEPLPHHEMIALLRRPNEAYSGISLWNASIVSWITNGNAYWLKIRNKRTRAVEELWYVPHWMIQPMWPRDGLTFISHYEYKPTGLVKEDIAPEDIIHFRHGLDPRNPRKGLSPISSVLREVFTDDEASNYSASVLRNMGAPGLIISPAGNDGFLSDPQAKASKADIDQHFTGDNRGRPMLMRGPTKIDQFGWSPKDMALGDIRNIPEERVCALLGLPAAVVGFGTGLEQTKVGASMREMISLAWKACIIPNQRLFADELHRSLLPEFEPNPDEFELWFDTSQVEALQESENQRQARLTAGVQGGWIRVDEARSSAGYEVDDSDKIYLRSMAMIEVPTGQPAPVVMTTVPKMFKTAKAPRRTAIGTLQRNTLRNLDRDRRNLETQYRKILERWFDKLGTLAAEAAGRILREPKGGNPAFTIDADFEADAIMRNLPIRELQNEFINYGAAHYLSVATQTFRTVGSALGIEIGMPDFVADRVIATGGRHLGLVDIGRQLRDRIFDGIWEGHEEGEGPAAIARRIRDIVPGGPWSSPQIRAEVIARTETMNGQRISTVEAYKESGVVQQLMVFDNRTGFDDEECSARDGQIIEFDEADALIEEEHPNGTLSFAPYIPTPGEE